MRTFTFAVTTENNPAGAHRSWSLYATRDAMGDPQGIGVALGIRWQPADGGTQQQICLAACAL